MPATFRYSVAGWLMRMMVSGVVTLPETSAEPVAGKTIATEGGTGVVPAWSDVRLNARPVAFREPGPASSTEIVVPFVVSL
ncbi:hypothetical protein CAL29_25885 [Bordetella genomosp. 10]|uniref:Uncharacterized protein n=1 Tax=Bordetella genomosp. 10 TaxID=1416804 RepID=A0A261S1Y0_9BORD|nr:hypothetical protein CAL29_25885 [Bordetella genomosp. 10]